MRKILATGLFTSFLIGIIFFFLKFLIADALASLFRPLILDITGNREYLVIPLTLVFTLIIILVVGLITTRIHFQDIFNKYLRKLPKNLEQARGALVQFDNDTWMLAIVIKEVEITMAGEPPDKYYVLYCPSAPFPWSGLPVVYARKSKVHLLKLSFGEIYSIVGSFGENTPRSLVEFQYLVSKE
ncbi:MAG TPA: hypothetical protein VF318_05955 [Dehalococcoidales bacterium]